MNTAGPTVASPRPSSSVGCILNGILTKTNRSLGVSGDECSFCSPMLNYLRLSLFAGGTSLSVRSQSASAGHTLRHKSSNRGGQPYHNSMIQFSFLLPLKQGNSLGSGGWSLVISKSKSETGK